MRNLLCSLALVLSACGSAGDTEAAASIAAPGSPTPPLTCQGECAAGEVDTLNGCLPKAGDGGCADVCYASSGGFCVVGIAGPSAL